MEGDMGLEVDGKIRGDMDIVLDGNGLCVEEKELK